MKMVPLNEVKAKLSEYVKASQKERVLVTSHGRPMAIITGVEGKDSKDLVYENDERELRILQAREKGPFIPWEQAKRELAALAKPAPKRKPKKRA